MEDLGLKNFFVQSFRYKTKPKIFIEYFFREIKYAWQRVWRGYDDIDTIECYEMFRVRMIKILESFVHNRNAYLNLPREYERYDELLKRFPNGYFDEEATDVIYETMIHHLKMMDENHVEKVLFGTCIYDDDYVHVDRTLEDYRRIGEITHQNKEAFMKLFSLFYYHLWD